MFYAELIKKLIIIIYETKLDHNIGTSSCKMRQPNDDAHEHKDNEKNPYHWSHLLSCKQLPNRGIFA